LLPASWLRISSTSKNHTSEMAEQFFGLTDTGKQRQNNEDAFIAERVMGGAFVAACVIDGVGGYEGGEVAAAIAREALLEQFRKPSGPVLQAMQDALVLANERILKEKQESGANEKMACVLTLALVQRNENKFQYAHIGDTRLYLFRDGSLVKITKDQSFVGFLEDSGRLTEEAAMSHPKRNEINKALGFEPILQAADVMETGESPFLPGDTLLLCSDGLTDMVPRALITSLLGSGEPLSEKAAALIRAANEAGGKDNITVVLVQNDRKPVLQKATKPAIAKKSPPHPVPPAEASRPKNEAPFKPSGRRPSRWLVPLLILISLASLAGFAWQWNKASKLARAQTTVLPARQEGPDWQRLQDTLSSGVRFLALAASGFPDTIRVPQGLLFSGDSVRLLGNGRAILMGDSAGSTLIGFGPNVKHVLLDSLSLENITLFGIASGREVIQFRNVTFRKTGVQYSTGGRMTDTTYTGSISRLASLVDTTTKK
jgi:serine/threonine protein phosphatase PrpC